LWHCRFGLHDFAPEFVDLGRESGRQIIHRSAKLLDFPNEQRAVKLLRTLNIVRGDFKPDDARRRLDSLALTGLGLICALPYLSFFGRFDRSIKTLKCGLAKNRVGLCHRRAN
jgi:hypothetical protein